MITKEQALTAQRFTHATAKNADGTPMRARRNGQTQTWKTRPDDFRVPIKHGLYSYGVITPDNAADWNAEDHNIRYRAELRQLTVKLAAMIDAT